jgi:septal ring factor EnvC (AmiA/AmiB activator)
MLASVVVCAAPALEALRGRIKALQAELDATRGEQDREREKLRATEVQIGNLTRDRQRIERDLTHHQERLSELERERTVQTRAIAGQRRELAAQVRAAHAMGRQEQLKIVLNQEDPARLGRVLGYYGYFNRARLARITAIETALDKLRQLEAEVLAEQSRLDVQDRELSRQRADEARLAKLLEQLQQALDEMPAADVERVSFGKQRGRLVWPASGRFSVGYGQARGIGGVRSQGVVIDAREGGDVHAVSHGRVAFADWPSITATAT